MQYQPIGICYVFAGTCDTTLLVINKPSRYLFVTAYVLHHGGHDGRLQNLQTSEVTFARVITL